MRIKTNTVSDGNPEHEVITSVDIYMDNGEWFRLYEDRPSASVCELRVQYDGAKVAVNPISASSVSLSRRQ